MLWVVHFAPSAAAAVAKYTMSLVPVNWKTFPLIIF